jgi:hypothetical protein
LIEIVKARAAERGNRSLLTTAQSSKMRKNVPGVLFARPEAQRSYATTEDRG